MSPAPNPRRVAVKRASCDSCRERKVKCDGKSTTCGRCARLGVDCVYSTQKPIGRPPRRRLCSCSASAGVRSPTSSDPARRSDELLSSPSNDAVLSVDHLILTGLPSPDSQAFSGQSAGSTSSNSPLHQADEVDRPNSTIQNASTHVISPSNTGNSPGNDTEPKDSPSMKIPPPFCACLATSYLMLDQIQANEKMSFPSGLHLLRDISFRARDIIQCPVCPTRSVSAMQNVSLLGALATSMAKQYGFVLKAIESEASIATLLGQNKLVKFQDLMPQNALPSPEAQSPSCESGFTVEMSPQEWMSLATKAVKAEIYGLGENSETSFMGMIGALEARQKGWHSRPPCSKHAEHHNDTNGDDPLCIKIICEAKRLINCLTLDGLVDREFGRES